ncbi:MAG: 5-formyltetrahydrofolate cyclo-ligase [Alphaproteobacteria bacterium]|nr:5-formyltetrahydrofolate cyclo-ligase [Alphaproteobacteria bacterium]
MTSKADIRRAMIAKRLEMAPEERAQLSMRICDKLLSIPLAEGSVVAGYQSMRGEVDISHALKSCVDKKYTVCLPSVTESERSLQFLSWSPEMPMKKGAHGTLEPDGGEAVTPAILWVPLVAFDRSGHRLGYGGGYYDATIAYLRKENPGLQTVGIAYSLQETQELPVEGHDMRLSAIVTEREIILPDPATSAGLGA